MEKLRELNKFASYRKRFIDLKMAEAITFCYGENMKIRRNIFKEEFEKQEKNIRNLISALKAKTMKLKNHKMKSEIWERKYVI